MQPKNWLVAATAVALTAPLMTTSALAQWKKVATFAKISLD